MRPPLRVVVTEGVVVQARFSVQVLIPEAQVLQEVRSSRQSFAQATALAVEVPRQAVLPLLSVTPSGTPFSSV